MVVSSDDFTVVNYKHFKPLILDENAKKALSNEQRLDIHALSVFNSNTPETIIKAFEQVKYWNRQQFYIFSTPRS